MRIAVIRLVAIKLLQLCTRATTTQLFNHAHNVLAINSLQYRKEQSEILIECKIWRW